MQWVAVTANRMLELQVFMVCSHTYYFYLDGVVDV